jgi:hemerythrin-like domain-containing protein
MTTRRAFLAAGAGAIAIAGCKHVAVNGDPDVAPAEDLMREHGVLERVLLVFEACATRLGDAQPPHAELAGAADVVRRFIEDYHEQLEEQFIFPRFRAKDLQGDLVETLLAQHRAGRAQTDLIIDASRMQLADRVARDRARRAIDAFVRMYRPHAAREDTVLFPALHDVISGGDLAELGERFEREEHERFGAKGFESVVEQVAQLERSLGIYELAHFTPAQS